MVGLCLIGNGSDGICGISVAGEADITQPISQRIWLARKKVFFYLVWASMPGSVYCYRDLAKIVNLECGRSVHGMRGY